MLAWGSRSLGRKSARGGLTSPQASADGPNAWIVPNYRRAVSPKYLRSEFRQFNRCGRGRSSALGVQTGQPMSRVGAGCQQPETTHRVSVAVRHVCGQSVNEFPSIR